MLINLKDSNLCAREEVFGPVLSIMRYDSLEDVLRRANASPYGLAACVVSSRADMALAIAQRIESGHIWINTYHAVFNAVEFGGMKSSGFSREVRSACWRRFPLCITYFVLFHL